MKSLVIVAALGLLSPAMALPHGEPGSMLVVRSQRHGAYLTLDHLMAREAEAEAGSGPWKYCNIYYPFLSSIFAP